MEQDAINLAHELACLLQKTEANLRLVIGISGIPASGKSTFAALLLKHTNLLLKSSHHIPASSTEYATPIAGEATTTPEAIVVTLDGWHLTRAQLDAMPDPKLAHDRRGSHWTFDSERYVAFVRSLKQASTRVITAPSFDHALKDPAPDTVSIHSFHRIVIIEGLYTFLSVDPWKEAGELLDGRWLIQIDFEEAKRRLVKRHVLTGVAKDEKEAIWRAEENDMPNGRFLLLNTLKPTRIIASIDDASLTDPLLPSGAGAATVF